ncbi:phage tail assembly protein T [Streptomyces sp.]|uniref:phage tail assembly protein T n=1 Tax=Streptomyces sp. TaxID=1931 RepID=UPI002F3F5FC1
MLASVSSAELTEWMAYEQITGPLGAARDDLLMSILASVVANAARGKKGQRARPKDFLPQWDRGRRMGWQEMLAAVKAINKRMGGTDKTAGEGVGDVDPGRAAGAPGRRRGRAERRRRDRG